jgi:hypothetical protein
MAGGCGTGKPMARSGIQKNQSRKIVMKICPMAWAGILAAGTSPKATDGGALMPMDAKCLGVKCAWYVDGLKACAVQELAEQAFRANEARQNS